MACTTPYIKRYRPERTNPKALNRSQLIARLALDLHLHASWYTISKAIREGLPFHPHPLHQDQVIFDWDEVVAWIEARMTRRVALPTEGRKAPRRKIA